MIATILMVAITVVLAGVLIAYLGGIRPPDTTLTTMGATAEKFEGNYTVSIHSGKIAASDLTYMIKRPDGTAFVYGKLSAVKGVALGGANNITFADNDGNEYLNPGDALRVWGRDGGGFVEDAWSLELRKGDQTVVAIKMVASR